MRTRTAIIASGAAFGVIIIGATVAPVGDVATLVHEVSRGAQPEPVEESVLTDEIAATARTRAAKPVEAKPLSAVGAEGAAPKSPPPPPPRLDLDATPAPGSPFVGTWMQESTVGTATIRVRLALTEDGRYTGVASLFPPGAPANASPSRRIETAGVWEVKNGSVVLSRLESSDHQTLPIGWREVYWDSSTTGSDWVYTDADGIERRLIRSTTGLGAKGARGTLSRVD